MIDPIILKFALFALRPNAKWHLGESHTIVWLDEEQTEPTDKEINDWIKATQYQRDRASAFPSIQDQLDMQYHDAVDGTTTWKDAVAKVKADNPKPS